MIQPIAVLTTWAAPLLAQVTDPRAARLRGLQERFQEPNPGALRNMLVSVLAIAAIFVLAKLLASLQKRHTDGARSQPYRLFRRMQAQLGLGYLERWRLWRVARSLEIEHPTALLISAGYFDHAVGQYLVKASPGEHKQLSTIRQRLFGKPEPDSMDIALPE